MKGVQDPVWARCLALTDPDGFSIVIASLDLVGFLWSDVEAIRKNILQADAVIIEVSFQDLQIGYETALAIAAKKPVLCLSIYEDFSQKIDNQYFFGAKYTELDVEEVVAEFVERVGKKTLGERFNLFLSAVQEEYLEHASREKGISKSEYVRNLIDKDKLEK